MTTNELTPWQGSDRWLAPEIVLGMQSYDLRSDVFSFALTCYEVRALPLPAVACSSLAAFATRYVRIQLDVPSPWFDNDLFHVCPLNSAGLVACRWSRARCHSLPHPPRSQRRASHKGCVRRCVVHPWRAHARAARHAPVKKRTLAGEFWAEMLRPRRLACRFAGTLLLPTLAGNSDDGM